MTRSELDSVMALIADCRNYIEGRKHSEWIANIAKNAADRAVIERMESLYERLQDAGLNLVNEEL